MVGRFLFSGSCSARLHLGWMRLVSEVTGDGTTRISVAPAPILPEPMMQAHTCSNAWWAPGDVRGSFQSVRTQKYIKKPRKIKASLKHVAVYWTLLDPQRMQPLQKMHSDGKRRSDCQTTILEAYECQHLAVDEKGCTHDPYPETAYHRKKYW